MDYYLSYLLGSFITIQKVETKRINVKIGDIAPFEIRATKDIVDERATEQLKREAISRLQPVYRVSPSVPMTMKSTIKEFFDDVRELQSREDIGLAKKIELLGEESRILLSRSEYQTALTFSPEELDTFERNIYDLINQIMGAGIREEDLEYEKENIEKIFESLDISEGEKELGFPDKQHHPT